MKHTLITWMCFLPDFFLSYKLYTSVSIGQLHRTSGTELPSPGIIASSGVRCAVSAELGRVLMWVEQ